MLDLVPVFQSLIVRSKVVFLWLLLLFFFQSHGLGGLDDLLAEALVVFLASGLNHCHHVLVVLLAAQELLNHGMLG